MNDVMDLALTQPDIGQFEPVSSGSVFGRDGYRLSSDSIVNRVEELKSLVLTISIHGQKVVTSYIEIGKSLIRIETDRLYAYVHRKCESYSEIFDFSFKVFGFAKSTTYNLMGVAKRFSDDVSDGVNPRYKVRDDQIERFTPDATVQEIRELRKYWDRYGYDDQSTWSVELQRCRQRAAEEDEKSAGKRIRIGRDPFSVF